MKAIFNGPLRENTVIEVTSIQTRIKELTLRLADVRGYL